MYSQAKLPSGEREEEGYPDCLLAKVHVQFPRRVDHRCVQSNPGNTNPRDVLHPVEEVCMRLDYGHVHRERDVADAKGGEVYRVAKWLQCRNFRGRAVSHRKY